MMTDGVRDGSEPSQPREADYTFDRDLIERLKTYDKHLRGDMHLERVLRYEYAKESMGAKESKKMYWKVMRMWQIDCITMELIDLLLDQYAVCLYINQIKP